MSRVGRICFWAAALGLFFSAAPEARGDSGETTTISSEDGALSRSASPQSLETSMPSGPPAYSNSGMPVAPAVVSPAATPTTALAPVSAAPVSAESASPTAPAGVVTIMDTRDAPGKLVIGRGKREIAAPGGAVLVDRSDRRFEIVPESGAAATQPIAAAPAVVTTMVAPGDDAPRASTASRRKIWRILLGVGGAALLLGLALR